MFHHHQHPGLGHLARSVSRVTVALSIVSLVSQLFSFLVGCSGIILKEFGFVAFFACVKASSICIHLSCLVLLKAINDICFVLHKSLVKLLFNLGKSFSFYRSANLIFSHAEKL
jgi:hypothetical protein